MRHPILRFSASMVAVLVGVIAVQARAQEPAQAKRYPERPVHIVVPFSAGGLTDVLTRGIADQLSKKWNAPVIVENKPGANTIIAADFVAQAAPDGYTLLMANDPTLSSNQYLYNKLPYDPVTSFTPVINIAKTEQILVVNSDSPYRTLNDLLEAARKKPDSLDYGSYGIGSKAHLDTDALARLAGVQFHHVPYKGVSDVVLALFSNQIDFALTGISPVVEHIKSGKLRGLAISSPERRPLFPDVPTFAESGFPNFKSIAWFGFAAPAGTSKPIVQKIADAVSEIIVQPDFQKRFIEGVGLELADQGPDEFSAFLKEDREEYERRIKDAGVKLDY